MPLTLPPLDTLNEADFREEFVTPVLHELGYRSGTPADIARDVPLRYPRKFIGRKKPSRDPVMVGKPDYVLTVDERVRWVLEAKPPTSPNQ